MKNWIFPEFVGGRRAIGLLLLRAVTGSAFIFHGWPKIQNAFGWMGPEAPVPGMLQACAAASEFFGGIALILGVLTPLASIGIAGTMMVAILMAHMSQGHPFVASAPHQSSYELAAVYLANVLLVLLVGPGKLSLDAILFNTNSKPKGQP